MARADQSPSISVAFVAEELQSALYLLQLGPEVGDLLLVLEGFSFGDPLLKRGHLLNVGLYALPNLFELVVVSDLAVASSFANCSANVVLAPPPFVTLIGASTTVLPSFSANLRRSSSCQRSSELNFCPCRVCRCS